MLKMIPVVVFVLWPQSAKASITTDTYCKNLTDRAKASRFTGPYIFSEVSGEGTKGPIKLGYEHQFKLGFGINIDEIFASLAQAEFAEAECARFSAEEAYLESLNVALDTAERKGREAELALLETVLEAKLANLVVTERRVAAKHDTVFDLLSIKQSINQLRLRKIDVTHQLQSLPPPPPMQLPAPSDSKSFARLQAANFAAAARSIAARNEQILGSPWKLALQSGFRTYTGQLQSWEEYQGKRVPFVQIEARYALGAIPTANRAAELQHSESQWLKVDPAGGAVKGADLQKRIATEFETATQKLETLNTHIDELEKIQKPLASVTDVSAKTLYHKLSGDLTTLALDAAYLKGKAEALTPLITPARPGVGPTTFKVTKGLVMRTAADEDSYRVMSSQMRLKREGRRGDNITVNFIYLGPSDKSERLGSGIVREQFGVYLLAADQCNALYVMIRVEDGTGKVVVQSKINPGRTTHEDCTNDGYSTIEPTEIHDVGSIRPKQELRLSAKLLGSNLTVEVDGKLVWRGTVSTAALAVPGYSGARTDNAKVEFQFD